MTEWKWAAYAKTRNLSRNRLLMARHSELVDHFVGVFGQVDTSKRVLDIGPGNGFFMVHFDCSAQPMRWTLQESMKGEGEGTEARRHEGTKGAV